MRKPAFQFYPGDYLSSTRVSMMTLEEQGAYVRLLCFCWSQGSLPADPEKLARLIGNGGSTTLATNVAAMFQKDPDDPNLLRHDRLDAERQKQDEWAQKSSKGGKLSAEMRKSAKTAKGGSTTLQPPFNHPTNQTANQKPTLQSSSSSSNTTSPLVPHNGGNGADAPPRKVRQKKAKEDVSDEQWLADLGNAPCYTHCDVPMQHAKAAKWCEVNRRNFTRKFFLNWLNRIEAPLKGGTTTKPRTWQPDPTDPEAF